MFVLIAGGGKVGANLTRLLLRMGHEVTLVEQRRDRFEQLEMEFEHQVQMGDATELYVLERAGIKRPPDIVVSATGDDEDNLVIGQLAREKYGVSQVIAVMRNGRAQIANGQTELQAGDQVLAILQPGKEDELRSVLLKG